MAILQEPQQAKQKTIKWFQITLIIAVVLLGAGYLFRLLTPTQVELQPTLNRNYQGGTTTFEKVTYIGIAPNFPNELPVATAVNFQPLNLEDRTVKDKLIAQYDLQRHPVVTTLWLSPSYALQEIEATGSYELSNQSFLPDEKVVDSVKALDTAKSFVEEYFPTSNLLVLEDRIIYREADVHGDVVEAAEAGLVEIPFGYVIEGYPVFLEKSVEYPISVMVNANNTIQKANFHPYFLEATIDGKIKTLSIPEALANINANKATIISSFYSGFETQSLENITSGALADVQIEYRVSSDTNRIVPYYRFKGQLTNSEGQEFYGEIITPAVQTQDSSS